MERHLSGADTTELAAATGTGATSPVPTAEDGAAGTEVGALPQWGPHRIEQRPLRAIESRRVQIAAATGAVVLALTAWALLPADTVVVRTTTPHGPPLPDRSTVLPATPDPSSNASPKTTPSASRRPTAAPPPPGKTAASNGATSATTNAGTARMALAPNTTRSLQSVSQSDGYVVQVDNLANVAQVTASSSADTKQAATFTVVPGLADASCFSFTASGRYLRHDGYRLRLDTNDSQQGFLDDATFCARTGSASGSVCLESKNYPNYYIHRRGGELWLDRKGLLQGTATFRAESSFYPVASWA